MSTMKILNRFTSAVVFEAELDAAYDNAENSIRLGLAVKLAVNADANLEDANLAGADLAGAKWKDGVPLTRNPIQISGAPYRVAILDRHMQIGCECHSLAAWESFTPEEIAAMDGDSASMFWAVWKSLLLAIARADGRSFDADDMTTTRKEATP